MAAPGERPSRRTTGARRVGHVDDRRRRRPSQRPPSTTSAGRRRSSAAAASAAVAGVGSPWRLADVVGSGPTRGAERPHERRGRGSARRSSAPPVDRRRSTRVSGPGQNRVGQPAGVAVEAPTTAACVGVGDEHGDRHRRRPALQRDSSTSSCVGQGGEAVDGVGRQHDRAAGPQRGDDGVEASRSSSRRAGWATSMRSRPVRSGRTSTSTRPAARRGRRRRRPGSRRSRRRASRRAAASRARRRRSRSTPRARSGPATSAAAGSQSATSGGSASVGAT